MLNTMRDAAFYEMCCLLHDKTFGVPNTGKGILSALEKTGNELCTASALITDTWGLNPNENGKREPLYPAKGEAKTEFAWFGSN